MKSFFFISLSLFWAFQTVAQTNTNPFSKKKKEAPAQPATMGNSAIQLHGQHTPMVPYSYQPVKSIQGSPDDFVWQVENRMKGLVDVRAYSEEGVPVFLRMKNQLSSRQAITTPQTAFTVATAQIKTVKKLLKLENPAEELAVKSYHTDALGMTHIKLTQTWQQIPVYGAEMIVHINSGNDVIINGRFKPTPVLKTVQPTLNKEAAITLALAEVAYHTPVVELDEKQKKILKYTSPQTELVIYTPPGYIRRQRLAWHITLRPNFIKRWEYFVDAHTGEILHAYDHTCSLGPVVAQNQQDLNGESIDINAFDLDNGFVLLDASRNMYSGAPGAVPKDGDGFILTADLNNTSLRNPKYNEITSTNNSWAANAVSAHNNSGIAYDYFLNIHNHNSINGNKGDIIAFVNVADDDGGGLDNAFWNGEAMFYGNGKTAFTSLAGGLDVGGHEMGHGVIQALANLEYQGQSGALNESFADIFGVMIDRDDWALGEDIIPNNNVFPSGNMRDMSDPHNGHNPGSNPLTANGYQPAHMSELFTGRQDNGGVHINSGIANKAFFNFANTTSKEIAEKVYFRALKEYLTRSSQFIDCRLAVIQAASDLYSANVVAAAQTAFDQVGITDGDGSAPPPILPSNPGQDFIVSTDINSSDPNTLYISNPDTNNPNFQPLSQTEHLQKISVLDDGSEGIFVGADHDMYALRMNSANPQESRITDDQFWDNVAISPDGSKIAAVSVNIDTAIYIYSFEQQQWGKYQLYSPTTAQGLSVSDVLYADAITWDLSGQYVLFDAFNSISSFTGDDIEYWDVGLLRAWDNASNDFGDGLITQIFSNLGEGVSIANAVFSKNSPNIIAFDYFNETDDEYILMGANLETGDVGVMFQNVSGILGYPSYSTDDDRIIFNAQTGSGDDIVAALDLAADKIRPATGAEAFIMVPAAQWGVWYGTGSRVINIGFEDEWEDGVSVEVFPNPFNDEITMDLDLPHTSKVKAFLFDLSGKQVMSMMGENKYSPGIHSLEMKSGNLPAGMYFLRVEVNDQLRTIRLVKQ